MQNLPAYISILFIGTTIACFLFLVNATANKKLMAAISLAWLALQGFAANTGFYTVTIGFPPRFILLIAPPLLAIIVLFATKKGRRFIDGFQLPKLTWLHTVRIPVELVLYSLFLQKQVPQLITFEGRNFDILSGITAPVIALVCFSKTGIKTKLLLAWNIICLCLLANVVVNAVLSAPLPFQQFGFEQPNVAILHFPFVWLPCFIVPSVLLAHLVAIRKLVINKQP